MLTRHGRRWDEWMRTAQCARYTAETVFAQLQVAMLFSCMQKHSPFHSDGRRKRALFILLFLFLHCRAMGERICVWGYMVSFLLEYVSAWSRINAPSIARPNARVRRRKTLSQACLWVRHRSIRVIPMLQGFQSKGVFASHRIRSSTEELSTGLDPVHEQGSGDAFGMPWSLTEYSIYRRCRS